MHLQIKQENPWLHIPVREYEAHMRAPSVGQKQMLDAVFRDLLHQHPPEYLAVLGCTAGNGFDLIDWQHITRVTGFDINDAYLRLAMRRFARYSHKMEFRCCDVGSCNLGQNAFDLIHGALIFEYIPLQPAIHHIFQAMKKHGLFSAVLQMPHESLSMVSKTRYQSLEKLAGIMTLHDPDYFRRTAAESRLKEIKHRYMILESGKPFYWGLYQKI